MKQGMNEIVVLPGGSGAIYSQETCAIENRGSVCLRLTHVRELAGNTSSEPHLENEEQISVLLFYAQFIHCPSTVTVLFEMKYLLMKASRNCRFSIDREKVRVHYEVGSKRFEGQ
jgi:hypothetical protein